MALILAAASSGDSGVNYAAIIVAAIALIGTLVTAVVPLFSKRVRGHSDVRDDKSVENTILKEAAETAMQLVDKAQAQADQAVEMIKGSLKIATDQVTSLNVTIETYQALIADMKSHGETQSRTIDRLEEDLTRMKRDKEAAIQKIREQQSQLAEKEAEISELTLSREEVRSVRETLHLVENASTGPHDITPEKGTQ